MSNGLRNRLSEPVECKTGSLSFSQDVPVQERMGEIPGVLEELQLAINRYDSLVDVLCSRLSAVLSPALPTTGKESNQADRHFSTDLGNYIEGIRYRVAHITNKLDLTIGRIEL